MISKEMIPDKKYWFIQEHKVYPVEFTQKHLNMGAESAFKDLFETKKEAELHLEFVGIKREEEFPYVSWEDFSGGLRIIEFVSFKHENIELSVLTISYETAYIQLFNSKTETMLFNKPLTEENYYEALRLAKKLFLGEE